MPYTPALADDLSTVDGLESVTLKDPKTLVRTAAVSALRRAVETRETEPSRGLAQAGDVAWHVGVAELGVAPRLGWRVIDAAGEEWTILSLELASLGTRWRMWTRNLAVAAGLDQLVTIEQNAPLKGAGGATAPAWTVYRTHVLARIQPVASDGDVDHARRESTLAVRILVQDEILVNHTHRVVAADGTIYQVTGYEQPDRIDRLFVILAEKSQP